LALGLFAQTKLPLLLPVIALLELFFLYKKSLRKEILLFLSAIIIGVITANIMFFFNHGSLREFLNIQKYIVSFYRKSKLHIQPGAFFQAILFGKFADIAN